MEFELAAEETVVIEAVRAAIRQAGVDDNYVDLATSMVMRDLRTLTK